MRPVYVMLAVAGWVWLVGLVGYVSWRRRAGGADVDPVKVDSLED